MNKDNKKSLFVAVYVVGGLTDGVDISSDFEALKNAMIKESVVGKNYNPDEDDFAIFEMNDNGPVGLTSSPNLPLFRIENWWENQEWVACRFCEKEVPLSTAHYYQHAYVGDECCWDEKLRSSE